MKELQLPICALFFSILLCIVYFSKRRVKLIENKIYVVMLLMGLLDNIILTIERILVRSGNINDVTSLINTILQITNKIDFIALIILCTCLFLYTLVISVPKIKNKMNSIIKVFGVIDIAIFIYIMFLNVDLITSGSIVSVSGGGIIPAYITCGIYLLLSVLVTIFNLKNLTIRHIPIISIIFVFVFLMIVFRIDPYVMVISITVTFVNYLMFFTIENPDLKMVNELLINRKLLEDQIEDKSDFLFEMSQGIKTPARNILEMTKIYSDLKTDKDKLDLVRQISITANDLIFKTNNILDVSSMDASKIRIVNEDYNPYKLFDQIRVLAQNSINDKDIKVYVKLNSVVPKTLSGDNVRLKQVVMSVLFNAIKNTQTGYINVSVDSINRYDVCRLIIKIEDTGKGMSIDKINEILDNSKELTQNEISKIDKLDIDLSVVVKIVKLLDGNINIKSVLKKGTEVTIVIDQKYKPSKDDVYNYTALIYSKKRVLVVDDDKDEMFKTKNVLSNYNIDINSTMIAKECIDRISSGEDYDLIIIDDELRTGSALSVLNELNKIRRFKTPVVVMIEKKKEKIKRQYLEDGFKYIILKEDLTQEINRIANKYL
ncbi:MAG TPA: response regulator [Candidatus Aphodocola excrementigallinarum]|uniref:histidine kinase n=1 Tax=Candidatus Aphodocola excrementigallinarum TaxID=2840670 RepID=A0A9D1LIG6_9FIRM|nr:response regulator [Candidatus Aphodocola excrementigallinarum]